MSESPTEYISYIPPISFPEVQGWSASLDKETIHKYLFIYI